ncbi:MAG: NADH-quinone oxidoreductase subunit NuoE [Anaerolineae bacterium]|nr:NADH-quinone oxidoreductase subunit NuoE [Anaerolineae bacterium]
MTTGVKDDRDVRSVVQAAVTRHGATQEALIPVMAEVNQALGYLPAQALEEIGKSLRLPSSHLVSVASFYRMFSTQPRGRHVIQFCESAPCHVMGGRELLRALEGELGLVPGATSADGRWTLLTASCLGVCGVGPVVIVDGDIYGAVTPERVPEILARYP